MKCVVKNLPKSQVEITITIPAEELPSYMQKAAEHMSEHSKIEGFRPGKAPYDIVKSRFGEQAILEEAADTIVRKNYFACVKDNNLQTISQPKIEVTKMAVGNPFEFKATAAILPEVTLGEYKNLGLKKEITAVTDEQIEKVLADLAKMQSKEVLTDKAATAKDKALVDMEMLKDGIAVDGGSAKGMTVYLAEKHFIPGFNTELIGLKKGGEKSFSLDFPKEHYQKHLAGAKVDFKIKMNDVYEVTPPEIDEEFAKKMGQKSLTDLKALLRKNIENETAMKDNEKWEAVILNKIVDNSKFGEIPEVLINEEAHKMVHELEHNVENEGMKFDDYLQSINKKESDLILEFSPEAVKRIKIALAIRAIGKTEKIEATDKEAAEEMGKLMNAYKEDNPEMQKQIREPGFAEYLKTRIENRKTLDLIQKANI